MCEYSVNTSLISWHSYLEYIQVNVQCSLVAKNWPRHFLVRIKEARYNVLKKGLHHINMIYGRSKVGIPISSISRQVYYHVLPGIMLLKAMVRWPMKSWPIGSWSHTRKRTRASSGMWTVNTSVSSHMGLNPAGPAGQDGEKRRKRVDDKRISDKLWEERKCDRDREWAQHSSIIQGSWQTERCCLCTSPCA